MSLILATGIFGAQEDGALLDLLVKKNIISSKEAEKLRADYVKEAVSSDAGKIKISAPVKKLVLYGDTRLRYEYRQAQSQPNPRDTASLSRFRYRLRLGMDVDIMDNWFFGFKLETNSNSRSTNITMGQTGGGQGFTKTNNTFYVGQAYLKYTPFSWASLEGGRMPNPFVTSPMVWYPSLYPEGFAQQFKYTIGPFGGAGDSKGRDGRGDRSASGVSNPLTVDLFANFGEFVYDTAAATGTGQNTFSGQNIPAHDDTWLLGFQVGARANFSKTTFLQTAPVFYFYSSTRNTDYTSNFIGVSSSTTNQTGINDLAVIEIPTEFDWMMGNTPCRIFGDFALNFQGDQRARSAALASGNKTLNVGNANIAYQVGVDINRIKKKGDWEFMTYWQQSDQYALDANLVDYDIFDAHLNMQGPVVRGSLALSDAVTFSVIYNYGRIVDSRLGTGGAGGTLNGSTGNPAERSFNLVQADLEVKF